VIEGVAFTEGYGYMSADLSRDGKLLAYAGVDKVVRLLDLESGAVELLPGAAKRIYEVHISPDGRSLAAAVIDGTLLLWDVPCLRSRATGSCLTRFTDDAGGYVGAHYPTAFSRDSRLLAWGVLRESTQLISVPDKRLIAHLQPTPRGRYPHEGTLSLGFSPDGTMLATTYLDGLTRLWDVGAIDPDSAAPRISSTPRLVIPEKAFISYLRDVFTPEGELVTTSGSTLTVRSPLTGAPSMSVVDELATSDPVFTPDGRSFLYPIVDGKLRVRDRRSGEVAVYAGHESLIIALAVDASGEHAATGAGDGSVRMWDLRDGSSRWITSHGDAVIDVMLSADGRVLASGSVDGAMHVSRIVPEERVVLDGIDDDPRIDTSHEYRPTPIALTPDGRWLAWIGRGRVVHRRAMDGGTVADLGALAAVGLSVAISPDGSWVAAGADDGTVRLWSTRGGEAQVLRGTPGHVLALAFSPDGRSLAWGSMEGLVRLVDLEGGATRVIAAHVGWVSSLAFDAAGRRLATGGGDTFIRVWDLANPEAPPKVLRNAGISKGGDWPWRLTFADGGRLLFARGGGAFRVWDLENGAMKEVVHPRAQGGDGALSPDASLVATGGRDNRIRIWDRRSGEIVRVLTGHSDYVRSLAWSSDGATLASGDYAGQVRLWDVPTGESRILAGHRGEVVKLLFGAGGNSLVSASRDGTVRIWDDSLPHGGEALRGEIAASLEIQ
jgi:WD40 repeat protein